MLLLCQNLPAIEEGKFGRILFQFVHGLLPNLTRILKSEFSKFPRASRACWLPINRPLSFKEKGCSVLDIKTIMGGLVES